MRKVFRRLFTEFEVIFDKFGRKLPQRQGGYFLPSITTDALVFRDRSDGLHDILLITRKKDPFAGFLAFPGGFVDYNEDPKEGCLRELKEECSIQGSDPVLVTVEGHPLRDPRGHVISIVYRVLVPPDAKVLPADDASDARFYPVIEIIQQEKWKLAFDHLEILKKGLKSMKVEEKY
jgi:8-oxo-dGTP diphosphatase